MGPVSESTKPCVHQDAGKLTPQRASSSRCWASSQGVEGWQGFITGTWALAAAVWEGPPWSNKPSWGSPLTLPESPQTSGLECASGQKVSGRECNPILAHSWILTKATPPHQRQDPVFPPESLPSGSLHTKPGPLHQRADRRNRRIPVLQQLKQKPHYKKVIMMKKQKIRPDKEDKPHTKPAKLSKGRQPYRKSSE